jgi:hypothetical protein
MVHLSDVTPRRVFYTDACVEQAQMKAEVMAEIEASKTGTQ